MRYLPIIIFLGWSMFIPFLTSSQASNEEGNLGKEEMAIPITGKVVQYSILSSKLENIKPHQTLYMLKIKITGTRDEEDLKEGEILKVYSKRELSPTLFNEIIKARIKSQNSRYWLISLLAVPPPDLPMEQTLYGLIHSVNPGEYAEAHGLEMFDNKVQVIAELISPSAQISAEVKAMIDIEARSQSMIRALVPIQELVLLAKDPAVTFVRPPQKPIPLSEGDK